MGLKKDDIDAVAINLLVDGNHTFQVYLTRGGLTQRMGSSDRVDPNAIMIKAATDFFEPFMAAVPDELLEEGGVLEDPGTVGPRHDWRFEFGGGMSSLVFDITYHAGSTGLPDEFADMVVRAEKLTHSWYLAAVAEETGVPLPVAGTPVAAPAPRSGSSGAKKSGGASKGSSAARPVGGRAKPGQLIPASKERIGLAVLLDLFALSIPYAFLSWVVVGGGERTGPPGAGLALFALVEFVLLQIARRSVGYWLLGMSAPPQGKPLVDPTWYTRESRATVAVGTALCGLGAAGVTSWTLYHTSVPYFGLGLPLWLSISLSMIGSAALVLAGALLLRTNPLGVWLAGGIAALLLLVGATGWSSWGDFIGGAIEARGAYTGRPIGAGLVGLIRDVVPLLLIAVPAALGLGVFAGWKRLAGRTIATVKPAATRT